MRVIWPLDAVLQRVIREPDAASYADPALLPALFARPVPDDPAEALARALVQSVHAPETLEEPLLSLAVWGGDNHRMPPRDARVAELLARVPLERAEAVLLARLASGHRFAPDRPLRRRIEDVLEFLKAVPSERVAEQCALPGATDPAVLKACVLAFTPAMWERAASLLLDREPVAGSARLLLTRVSDASEPRWDALWVRALGSGPAVPSFWDRLRAHPRGAELVEAVAEPDPKVGLYVSGPALAEHLVAAWLEAPQNPARVDSLAAQGEHAVGPLAAALEAGKGDRVQLVQALSRTRSEARFEPLIPCLFDGKKPVREAARVALSPAPFALLEPALREALTDRRKTRRKHALDVLEARAGESATLASERVDEEADAALAERLRALAHLSPPAEGAFVDLEAEIASVDADGIGLDLLAAPNPGRRFADDPRGTLMELAALAPLARPDWQTSRSTPLTVGTYLDAWRRLPIDDDVARYALARSIVTTSAYRVGELLDHAPHDDVFHEALIEAARLHRPLHWDPIGRWLQRTAAVVEAIGVALEQGRGDRIDFLFPELGDAVLPLLAPRLAARKAADRKQAATWLVDIGTPEALRLLQERLPVEKSKGVREVILRAVRHTELGEDGLAGRFPVDADLDGALAALDAPDLPGWVAVASLPTPRWADGTPMSDGARTWLLGTLASMKQLEAGFFAIVRRLDDGGALYESLVQHFDPETHRADARWMAFAVGFLGTPAQIDVVARGCDEMFRTGRHGIANHVLDVLFARGDATSIRWFDHWSRKARSSGLAENAAAHLQRLADAKGLTVPALLESALPTLGFAADGRRTLESGDRTFTLEVVLGSIGVSHQGRDYAGLPAARKGEDADDVKAAKARFSELVAEVKAYQQVVAASFEGALASGRSWTSSGWLELVGHPVVRPVAEKVVFITGKRAFSLVDGRPLDEDGNEVVLAEVRVAHPIETDLDGFDDRIGEQPFEQVDRTAYALDQVQELLGSRTRVEARTLFQLTGERGYRRGDVLDGGWVFTVERVAPPFRIALVHSGYVIGEPGDLVRVEGLQIWRGNESLAPSALPPRLLSEVGLDLASLP